MTVRRGISVLDLLPQTTAFATQVPDATVERISVLTVLDHRSTASADFFLHEGTLQALSDAFDLNTTNWPVRIPGLTHGLPFRLAIQRTAPAAGALEVAPTLWTLDIEVRDVEVVIPGVQAAQPVGGTGVTPLTLQATGTNAATQRVVLAGSGTLRVTGGLPGGAQVAFMDTPDPLDPLAPSGAIARLTARPPSFLFGNSQFGMTLDSFTLDFSPGFTPPEIAARGHDETWEGVAFKEATLYFPPNTPLLHSLSLSTRDVIIGDPGGLQGELRVEFGQDFNDVFNTRITVKLQGAGGAETDVAQTPALVPGQTALRYPVPAGANGTAQRVRAVFNVGAAANIPGHAGLYAVGVYWKLPDGREGTTASTPWFDAPTTGLLRYRLRVGADSTAGNTASPPSAVPADQTELSEVTASFPRAAGSPSGVAPIVDATIGGTLHHNIIHLRGQDFSLSSIILNKRAGAPAGPDATWRMGGGSAPVVRTGPSFSIPPLPAGTTTLDITVSDTDGTRRVRLEVVAGGPVVVGHAQDASPTAKGMVTVTGGGAATPTGVSQTFLARPFHLNADRPAAPAPATLAGTLVTVPVGTDAEVEVPVPSGISDPLPVVIPPVPPERRSVQVLFAWEEPLRSDQAPARVVYPFTGVPSGTEAAEHEAAAVPIAVRLNAREQIDGSDAAARLRAWIAALGPAAGTRTYVMVGRTDDLWYASTAAENKTNNDTLAQARLDKAREALIAAGAAPGSIVTRIESAAAFTPAPPAGALTNAPPRFSGGGRLALPAAQLTKPAGANAPVWNGRWNPDGTTSATHTTAKDDNRREGYRCVEIFAADSGGPPPPPPPPPGGTAIPVRMLVPGPDGPPDVPAITSTSGPPPTDYRVRLRVKWDSPTVIDLADAVPTEAEALVAWKTAQVEIPGVANPIPAPTGQDYWELLLHWTYDNRTGQTEASGALSLPDGTVNVASNALAGAMAIGPAITAMVAPSATIADPVGNFVLAAAMIAAGAVIGEALNSAAGSTPSRVDIDRFAVSYKWNGAAHVAATVDYTVDLHVNVDFGAGKLTGALRLKYKGVGLRFDGAPGGGLAGVALTYDDLSVEVVDPGTWSLGGPLGNLIRIAASRMGNGSQWMEFDLEFALDLGVVRLEGARIRLDLDPFKVEFRGLAASIDIPNTLRGRGSVTIGDGGSFRALLALEVIPAKLSAYGALAVDGDFVSVEVGIQLPVGIPLGGTGFGIFGFMGRFVANGTRNLDGLTNPEPVQKQLDWYGRAPQDKYKPLSGQYAFGVGAVIGTLPDGAFTFNAEGSLTIGFPDISVVFAIDAHLISQRKQAATESSGGSGGQTFRILGMVVIEPDSIMVGVRANYEIPKVLKLSIPVSAYFPLAGGNPWYIRIGTDGYIGSGVGNDLSRPGDPITITLLPDTLDVRAWAFVMVEERQMHHLGGTLVPLDLAQPLDFDGFSIGMGAGFDLKWEAGPFSLEISAFLLLGLGTKPLLFAGAAGVRGELDLCVISVGVDGLVHFHVSPGYTFVEGHFCGHVDCWLFEISGCVDIRIGDDPPVNIPVPDSPIAGMDLCDHLAVVKGRAARTNAEPVPVVWPDTIAVLRFQHFIADGLGTPHDFDRKIASPAALSPWSGTTELKYAFRLKTLSLWRLTGANPANAADWTQVHGPFDSAWWMPTHRAAVIQGPPEPGPSTEEGRELGLFSWDPRAWSRWLGEGAQDLPGDPANTVDDVCDPTAPADPSCAHGRDREPATGHLAGFKAKPAANAAIPSRFTVFADLDLEAEMATLAALGAEAGWAWAPGAVGPLHGGIVWHGTALSTGWRFPNWRRAGAFIATAPIALGLSKPLLQGELVLEICDEGGRTPPPAGVCDSMPDKDTTTGGFTGTSGTKYEGVIECFAVGGERAARILKTTLTGQYPGVTTEVSVDLDPDKGLTTLLAHATDGSILGTVATAGPGRQTLRIAAAGIARMSLRASDGQPVVFEVCWGGGRPAILSLVDIDPKAPPRVIATNVDGKTLVLEGTPVPAAAPIRAAIVVQKPCPKYVFELPPSAGWTQVAVAPWTRGDITLVALCGVTMEAAAAQADDQTYKDTLTGVLLDLADKAATDTPTHDVYLDPIATYEIRVGWQYQGWRPNSPGDEPGPPNAWTDAPAEERFRFSTAAFGLQNNPPPAQNTSLDADPAQGGPGYDERTFDPRGIARFVTRATPGLEDPPHFLDDHIGFWFLADHMQKLADKYDRVLQAKVLLTQPAPGAMHRAPLQIPGNPHVLDVTTSAAWTVDTLTWFDADFRFSEAAGAAPCIGKPPAMGGSSVSVTADLKPQKEYDLLLNTVPKTVGAFAETVITRSHFRTSRYRNPAGLLRGLGFATPLGLSPPTDAIVQATIAGSLKIGDTQMDAALTTLGLDPWPLSPAPRTTALWLPPLADGVWRLAGVLLEADEPIWRAGFTTGAQGEPPPPPRLAIHALRLYRTYEAPKPFILLPGKQPGRPSGGTITKRVLLGGAMSVRVRNAAATRMILTPATPIPVKTGRLYDLELQFKENGVAGAKGRMTLFDRPLTVAQEGE